MDTGFTEGVRGDTSRFDEGLQATHSQTQSELRSSTAKGHDGGQLSPEPLLAILSFGYSSKRASRADCQSALCEGWEVRIGRRAAKSQPSSIRCATADAMLGPVSAGFLVVAGTVFNPAPAIEKGPGNQGLFSWDGGHGRTAKVPIGFRLRVLPPARP